MKLRVTLKSTGKTTQLNISDLITLWRLNAGNNITFQNAGNAAGPMRSLEQAPLVP